MRLFKRRISSILAFVLMVTGVLSNLTELVHAATADVPYTQDFTENIGGWEKVYGGGIVTHVDSGLNIEAANWPDKGQYTLVVDKNSPEVQDGVLETDIKVKSDAGRLGLVFRYVDTNNYTMIGYDISGKWVLKNVVNGADKETVLATNSVQLQNGKTYRVRIEFAGTLATLKIDGNTIYSGNSISEVRAGKIGIRQWGYTDNYSHANYDNMIYYAEKPAEETPNGDYLVSFDDNDIRGWSVDKGTGTATVSDGKMTTAAGGNDANTFTSDKKAPLLADGFVETAVTVNNNAGRFAILFRYENATSFAGIGYDVNGVWRWFNGTSNYELPIGKVLTPGTEYKITVKYSGEYITVLIDDVKMFAGNLSGIKTTAGKIGLRNWGYTGNFSSTTFDYFINGDFSAVTLEPDYKFVAYNEAGTYDVPVNLVGNNTIEKLMVGNTELVNGEDYVINGDTLTIKKEFVAKVKDKGDTKVNILFVDGYSTTFTLQVQLPPDESSEYLRDFSKDGIEGLSVVNGQGTVELVDGKLSFKPNGTSIVIDENSPELFNSSVEFTVDPSNDNANIGVVVRYASEDSWTYIGQDGSGNQYGSNWYVRNSQGQVRNLVQDSARIYAKRVVPYKIKVKVIENTVSIYLDNAEIFHGVVPELTRAKGKSGLRLSNNNGAYQYLAINSESLLETLDATPVEREIKSDELTVKMDEKFPRVIDYTLNGKKLYGQEKPLYYVSINNKEYVPTITSTFTTNGAVYKVTVEELGVSFDTRFEVVKNTLGMYIENVNEGNTKVYTINFPYHSLVSMRNTQAGAEFNAANYAKDDIKVNLTTKTDDEAYSNTSIAILSCNDLAASIKNNSIKNVQEINYQTFVVGDHYSTGLWTNEYLYRGIDNELINEPWTKVTITGDRNNDSVVNYQDGAIALRDDISEERLGVDLINQAYSSVAMNVGSVAQYPFLRILDNIKKFNLISDGFEQTIIIKGYQSEGHDSMHPNFADISERAGGVEEFQTLLKESEKYNANIGVHINHTEAYPEAPQYGDVVSTVPGWSWYDNANQIIRENDIMNLETGMGARLEDLIELAPGLDMVYIDVYMDGRWPAYKLTSKLNEMGIAVASEYAKSLTKTSVWAHHAYNGGYGTTSTLARFVNHQEQDIFGGSNLFRGNTRQGINGWQGESDLNVTVKNFFTSQLPFKYLMGFPVSKWEDNQITFGYNNEVVSKMEGTVNVITKDGKEIARGNKVFIPWDSETEEKIYHWNDSNSATTWTLPDSWSGLENVYLYELTDLGKVKETSVPVINNQVTLSVKANTGYVVYKGKQVQEEYEWSTGGKLKDMGFDSHSFDYWTKSSSSTSTNHINIVNNTKGNSHVRVEGNNGEDAIISQKITGLTPGESYAANVWFEVSDGRKATIKVTTEDGKEVSNYLDRSNVLYGHTHNDKYNTYYQNVEVKFIVPEGSTEATLELIAAKGANNSWVNMDDVRVMKSGITDKGDHYYFNDFENVTFGYGPFVSTKSDNSHLSETNKPYTSDTIDGRFSMKIRSGNYMRTLPNTIRFKPETRYEVGFDYIAYNNQAAIASIKSTKAQEAGDTANATVATFDLTGSGDVRQATLEFTTGNYDDYYLEITKVNGSEYIIDNVYVDEFINVSLEELETLVNEVKALNSDSYTAESFAVLTEKLVVAEAVIAKGNAASEDEVRNVFNELKAAKDALVAYATAAEIDALKAIIAEMKAVNSQDYKNDDKWTAFQDTIKSAEALVAKSKVTVTEVRLMTNSLYNAKEALLAADSADKTAIIALVAEAEKEREEDYLKDTAWLDFKQDITEALAVIANDQATQEEVNYRYNKLKASHDSIIPLNKEDLTISIDEAKGYKDGNYTDESLAALSVEIELAEAIINNPKATRRQVADARIALAKAIEALVEKEESLELFTRHLEIAIELASNITEADLTDVVPVVKKEFVEALEEAKAILASIASGEVVTQETVNNSFDRLSKAMQLLEHKGNKTELLNLVTMISELEEEKFTTESWTKLQEVLNNDSVKEVINDENALQKDIENAYQLLKNAFDELELKPEKAEVDKSKLEALVNKVKELDKTKYIDSTWNKFNEALESANNVLKNEEATQEEVDSIYKELIRAYLDLRLKPNKDLLEELIKKAETLKKDDYTKDSWKAFDKALKVARSVMKNEDATEEEVKDAEKSLEVALTNLQIKNQNNNTNTNGNSNTTNNNTNSNSNSGKLPQTGGVNTTPIVIVCLIVVGIGAILVFKKKKK